MVRTKNKLIQEVDEHERTVKEKDEIERQLASRKKMNENLRQEGEALKADISALESDLKAITKINKIKDKEVHDLNKDNKTLSENMENLNMDLKMLAAQVKKFEKDELKKVRQVKETQNIKEFPCAICPKKFESSVKLNVHVKLDHCKANLSQTDEILVETKSAQTKKETLITKLSKLKPMMGCQKNMKNTHVFTVRKRLQVSSTY